MKREQFVSEPIVVDTATISPAALARGAPGCPMRFTWRGREYRVVKVLDSSRQLRAHDSSETYVKSHSFRVLTDANLEMVLRCDRQVRGNPWRLYTIRPVDGMNDGAAEV